MPGFQGPCAEEAWKQQQLARHWSRQALADEAQAMRNLPKARKRG